MEPSVGLGAHSASSELHTGSACAPVSGEPLSLGVVSWLTLPASLHSSLWAYGKLMHVLMPLSYHA